MCINLHRRFIIPIESTFRVILQLLRKGTLLENEAFRSNNKATIMLIFAKPSLISFPFYTRASSRLLFVCVWTSVILKCLRPHSSTLTLKPPTPWDTVALFLEAENGCVGFFFHLCVSVILTDCFPIFKRKKSFLRNCSSAVTLVWGLCIFREMWDLRAAVLIICDINNLTAKQIFVSIAYSLRAHNHLIKFRPCLSKWIATSYGLWITLSKFDPYVLEPKDVFFFFPFHTSKCRSFSIYIYTFFFSFWMLNIATCWYHVEKQPL